MVTQGVTYNTDNTYTGGILSQDTGLKMAFENKEELLKLRREVHFVDSLLPLRLT